MLTINQLNKKKRCNLKKIKTSLQTPQKKGICKKVFTMSPKKPNSALRKVIKLKLSNNKDILAHVPGEGCSIQEHNFILIRGGKVKDLPGIHYRVVRGAFDTIGVSNRKSSRSKYGTKKFKK